MGAERVAAVALAAVLLAGDARGADLALGKGVHARRVLGAATARARGVHPGPGVAGSVAEGLWIASGARVYEVREGAFVGGTRGPKVTGVAILDGELLAIRGKSLLALEGERFVERAALPYPGMRMRALGSGDGLLLYGGTGGRSVFLLSARGTYERYLDAPAPITAAAEARGEILFATGRDLWLFARLGRATRMYRAAHPILSIEVDVASGFPWFATTLGVYRLEGAGPVPLALGTTGFLHHDGRELVVVDPLRRQIVALREGGPVASAPRRTKASPPGRVPVTVPSAAVGTDGLDFLH